ncbi:MAG TPA: ABC transporter substrate-binding protein [Acidimicrobiia bacterium]|nr:ABC transporter substrate-binding protein [Acidimicrobiia bacterium]
MDRTRRRAQLERVDAIRRRSNPLQNHVIDEVQYGKITRREFLRKGSLLGLSFPVMGMVLAACADETAGTTTTAAVGGTTTTAAGGGPATTSAAGPATVRTTLPAPAVGIDPVLINDEGGLATFGQAAEYLIFSDDELTPVPVLADSWEPNADGDVWTFNLNPNATFHDGSPVTAEDVVATVQGIAGGNAASAFETFGVDPGQVVAVDPQTVEFTLAQPNGAFPFFMSSDNYNAAILPASFWADYSEGSYEQSFIGSGPWINESFDPGVSAVYVKNEDYWRDNSAQPDRMEITFFADEASAVTGFQEGRFDTIPHISYSGATPLLDDPNAMVTSISTAQHRQVYFDTSAPPFDDPRVRQAIALSLNRPTLIDGLLGGYGVVGNDHPIWQNYPMYNGDAVAQREEDLATARQLLSDAGYPDGFEAPLDTLVFFEVEDLAQLIAGSAAQIGVTLSVGVYDSGTYYNDYWLAAAGSMGIVNYGHRGVPNVYLGAPLLSDGTWNASHWVNTDYDALFDQFATAGDLDSQREVAGQIQSLLNEEVPFIVPYYVDHISVSSPTFSGLEVTGMGHYNVVSGSFSG